MDIVTTIIQWISSLPEPLLVTATGVLVFAETTIAIGFIAPGESGLLVAATSIQSVQDFLILWAVVTVCAGLGDSIGYAIGRRFGPRLRETKLIQKYGTDAWDKATDLLRRRGAWAVFFARFLPVVRTLTPAAAGTSKLPFRKFLPAVVAGTICWSAAHLSIGAALGEAAKRIENALSTGGAIVVGIGAVALVIAFIRFKRKRAAAAAAGTGSTPPEPETNHAETNQAEAEQAAEPAPEPPVATSPDGSSGAGDTHHPNTGSRN